MLFVFRFTLKQQPVCFTLPPKGASNPKMCRCSVLSPGSGTFRWSVSALVHMPTVAHADIFQFFRLHYNAVQSFREKSKEDSAPINAGYMVLEPEIFDYLDGDECIFEQAPLEKLAEEGQLMSYRHRGFWQCMDTMREKIQLENLWSHGKAPWKIWE